MHIAEGLHQRLVPVVDIDHLALRIEGETHRGLLVAGVIDGDGVVVDHLCCRIEFLHLDRGRDGIMGQRLKMTDIDGVFAGDDAAHGDDFLADRRRDLLAVDHDEVVGAAAVVAIQHQEPGLAPAVPRDIAGRILYEQVEIVGMVVGPVHGDDELGLGVDLAVLGVGRDRQQRQEKKEGDHLQRLEQHHAEGIERLLARIKPEVIDHGGVPAPERRGFRSR